MTGENHSMDHAETIAGPSGQDCFLDHRALLAGFYCGSHDSNPVAGAPMLERYLTAASTYAHSIDHLFILIAVLVGFWLIARGSRDVLADLQVSRQGRAPDAVHHRRRKHLKRWITIPHFLVIVCDIVILVRRDHGLVQHQAGHAAGRRRPCASSASNGPGASSSRARTEFWTRPMTFAPWANCT